MATIKKAQTGAKVSAETMSLRKKYAAEAQQKRNNNAANAKKAIKQNASKSDSLRKVYAKKAQNGTKITVGRLKKVSDSLNTVGSQKVNAGIQRTVKSGYDSTSKELVRSGKKDISNATRYNSIIKKKKK